MFSVGGWLWQRRSAQTQASADDQVDVDAGLKRVRDRTHSGRGGGVRSLSSDQAGSGSKPRSLEEIARERADDETWPDPNALSPDQAIDAFQEVMSELEQLAAQEVRLSRSERGELYNRATGSFTVLSHYIYASDPTERALLEDANRKMRSLLGEVGATATPPDHNIGIRVEER